MKVLRIFVTSFLAFTLLTAAVTPARAEVNANFVKEFLNRYRPSKLPVSAVPASPSQDTASLIRTGQMPLTVGDLINLMLQNNLDITVNRLSPLSALYLSQTLYRPFEPMLQFTATV